MKTATQKLEEILKKYGKLQEGVINTKGDVKYHYDTYYIQNPLHWVVDLFRKASKENSGEYRHFKVGNPPTDGAKGFSAEMPKFKGESCGMIQMRIFNLI